MIVLVTNVTYDTFTQVIFQLLSRTIKTYSTIYSKTYSRIYSVIYSKDLKNQSCSITRKCILSPIDYQLPVNVRKHTKLHHYYWCCSVNPTWHRIFRNVNERFCFIDKLSSWASYLMIWSYGYWQILFCSFGCYYFWLLSFVCIFL